jgi:cell division protein FtsN
MSNYAFGLRGDPFVPPATLSAKEASRLIRRRIRACNGDGGLLFPIDACDAIHAAAKGVPDAVLMLAGRALAIAAADKARCVTPAHVKRAAEEGVPAPATAAAAAMPVEAAEPAPPPVQGLEADDEDGDTDGDEEAVAEVAAAAPGIESFDYADSDLPPFRPASVALPTRPSEDLPIEAREWVSRFIPDQPGPPPAAQSDAPRVAHAAAEPPAAAPARTSAKAASRKKARKVIQAPDLDDIPGPASLGRQAALYTPPAPRPGARPGPRRQNTSRALVGVLGVVAVLAIVLRYSTPGHLATPESESARTRRTSSHGLEPRVPSPPQVTVVRPESHTSSDPPAGSAFYEARGGSSPAGGSAPLAGAESAPALEPVKRTAPSSRFALEVASFIFEERARQERDRLAAAGLHARVVTTLEFGSRVYRVVIGGYPHPAAAERAADSLLSNGVVLQARVVSAIPGR